MVFGALEREHDFRVPPSAERRLSRTLDASMLSYTYLGLSGTHSPDMS